ncbi:MAG: NUDIX hydrolase, partial [Sandaracinaceae bacterium]|nr:NUDIX hydrolase [Sandaracinaceae bacterium]
SNEGFIRVRRLELLNHYGANEKSRPYRYDCVERDCIDAVAILLYTKDGRICLRSALRPPLMLRPTYRTPFQSKGEPFLFEVPAGLIEADEVGEEGVFHCAARESREEVGVSIEPSRFRMLGPPVYLSPGLTAEKVHFACAEVREEEIGIASSDGSPVEERAVVIWVPLELALQACRNGQIEDAKTEIAVRRFGELKV